MNGTLFLTAGTVQTATNKVVLATGATVSRTNGYVVGSLQKPFAVATAVTNLFELGDTNAYSPVSLVLSNVTVAGATLATVTTGDHASISNSGVAATRSVNLWWNLTNLNGTFGTASATFNHSTNVVDAGVNPLLFLVARRFGTNWTLPNLANLTLSNLTALGLTNFGDFIVGQSSALPTITTNPASLRVNLGGAATFTVAATGAGPITYQWKFNGTNLAGATNTSYTLANVADVNAGSYSCTVSNLNGANASSSATLTINHPPSLTSPGTQTINELVAWSLTNAATDTDGGTLTYSLTAAPSGASIAAGGVISWTPSEAQGPSTNTFTVQVTDDGSPALTNSTTFSVIVNEVNTAPSLSVPGTHTLNELATLNVSVSGSDTDAPANTLSYSLVSAPTGMSINPVSGAIAWTPTEAQGPSTNLIAVRVTDNGSPNLSTTNSFTVIVNEVNAAPVLTVPAAQTLNELTTLNVSASATDADLPMNTLTFALVSAPTGASIDASSGTITWTPTEAQGPSTNTLTVRVTDNGSPSLSTTNSFSVIVTEVNSAPVLTVPANQTLNELSTLTVTNTATDSDAPTNTLTFSLVSAPTGMSINAASGVITWTPTETQGPSTNSIVVAVTDSGSPALSATNSFTVTVNEVNSAPALILPAPQTLDELTTLSVSASATDADAPANTLTFALVSAPSGVSINPSSGLITWTPTEAQGPSTNLLTVRVTDDSSPNLSATNSFTVIVREVNTAPALTVATNQIIDELTTLTVTNSATDADAPANTLTFSLVSAPTGMTINATNGIITWTPSETQGPSTNTVTVAVTDNGTPNLSTTNSFTVTVNEVNVAPGLSVPATQTLDELTTLSVSVSATDADLPTNTLTFSLVAAPTGVSIDANSGALTWTPTEAQGPSTNTITVRVTDDGSPNLSATNSFTVIVRGANTAPALTVPGTQTVDELATLNVSVSATDADLPTNTLTFSLLAAPTGMALDPNTGAITWTPTRLQGPSTNVIVVRVQDNGSPSLSDTNTFTVIVNEVNDNPTLTVPGTQTLNELATLSVTATATDPDIPTNTLTFSLVSAPDGMTINGTSGVITWTPTEAQGPSTNTITVKVSDDGMPSLSDIKSFTVIVTEVNDAPVLTVPTNQVIDELATLTVTNTAVDPDLPANTLTFALVSAPTNMVINATNGVITWTPTEAQGPSTNIITVCVTDDGAPNLSTTNSFTVTVNEVNSAPALPHVDDLYVNELTTLVFTNLATDADLPANRLTYTFLNAPVGMSLNANNGVFTWTPTEQQGPATYSVIVVATDNGTPALSATNRYTVVVNEVNSAPVLPAVADQVVDVGSSLSLPLGATDTDKPINKLTYMVVTGPQGLSVSTAGLVTWTPTDAQRPSTNTVIISVTDNGLPALGDTKSFTVRALAADDTNAPTVSILSPAIAGLRTTNATVVFSGTARDSRVVTRVRWNVNGGAYSDATGSNSWTATVPLIAGTNTLSVIAEDDSGNVSAPMTRTIFRVVTSRLTVNYLGRGNATPNLNGSLLELNRTYTLTAQPATDWILTNWSGDVSSTNLALTFTMTSNLVLNANFVSNPIVAVAGTYNGLFADTNGTEFDSAGFFTLKLVKTGGFSGNAQVDGGTHAFAGAVGRDGHGTAVIARPGKSALTLDLQLDLNNQSDQLVGTVSSPDWSSALLADRAITAATYKGAYTFVIPGSTYSDEPHGLDCGTATVTAAGVISMNTILAEGTAGRQTVALSKNGDWPLFIPLQYASFATTNTPTPLTNQIYHGLVIGWVHVNKDAPRATTGTLLWLKDSSGLGSTQYLSGFSIETALAGARYVPPTAGTRAVAITNGLLTLSDGGLAAPLSFPLTLSTANKVTFAANTNKVSLTISPTTGVVKGLLTPPGSTEAKPFSGVIRQDTGVMLGGFLGDTDGGTFSVQPR